ncbi:MAG: PepSY domain-containing protein [Brooklawnia sp.]|uniref:PepSY domain-containing protein n=1 Tax=Brooklawnia sp. TaxID=2699740 RepID=UPI003C78FF2F
MAISTKWRMTIAGLGVAALLSGCGNGGTTTTPAETPVASPETTATTPAQTAPDTGSSVLTEGFAAVALAESEVPGSQAVGLDLDDDGSWEVEVISGERKFEFDISADGRTVLEREEDDADDDKVSKLAQVQVPITDAISTAMTQVAGQFDDAELDEEDGRVVWEVNLDDDVDVHVDVVTGEIVNR